MEKLGQGYGYILYESQLKYEGPIERSVCGAPMTEQICLWMKSLWLTLYDRELLNRI